MQKDLLPVAREIAGQEFEAYTGDRVAAPTQMQETAYAGYHGLQVPERKTWRQR